MTYFDETIQALKGALFIFVVPFALFYLAQWDPIMGVGEDGDPNHIGLYFIIIPYWMALFFVHKYKTRTEILQNELLGLAQLFKKQTVDKEEFLQKIESLQWVDRDFYNEIIRYTKKDI